MPKANIDKTIKQFVKKEYKDDFIKLFNEAREKLIKEAPANYNKSAIGREAAKIAKERLAPLTRNAENSLRKTLIEHRDLLSNKFLSNFSPEVMQTIGETEATIGINGIKSASGTTGNILRDIVAATDDVLTKAANGAETIKLDTLSNNTDKLIKSYRNLKVAKILIPFFVILGLLYAFPKVNNWITKTLNGGKDQFPGLAGISGDETEKVSLASKNKPSNNDSTPPAALKLNTSSSNGTENKQTDIIKKLKKQPGDYFAEIDRRLNK
jgi:hypothetical protein